MQTFIHDVSVQLMVINTIPLFNIFQYYASLHLQLGLLPCVCGVREGFIDNFLRLLDRKALALIKYVEAKS